MADTREQKDYRAGRRNCRLLLTVHPVVCLRFRIRATFHGNQGEQQMKTFVGTAVVVIAFVTSSASALGATTYYIGHGDKLDAKVSFKVKGGEVHSALLDIRKMPVKRPDGSTQKIQVYGSVAKAPSDSGRDSHFSGINKTTTDDAKSRFGITGHLWSTRDPDGHTSMKVMADAGRFNTGKIRWDASPVSKERFKKFRERGGALTDRPSAGVAKSPDPVFYFGRTDDSTKLRLATRGARVINMVFRTDKIVCRRDNGNVVEPWSGSGVTSGFNDTDLEKSGDFVSHQAYKHPPDLVRTLAGNIESREATVNIRFKARITRNGDYNATCRSGAVKFNLHRVR